MDQLFYVVSTGEEEEEEKDEGPIFTFPGPCGCCCVCTTTNLTLFICKNYIFVTTFHWHLLTTTVLRRRSWGKGYLSYSYFSSVVVV